MGKNKKGPKKGKSKGGGQPKYKKFTPASEQTYTPVDNPFEIRVNKRKHDNLGKRARNEQGVPGISRSKAIEKRNKTLLKEFETRSKTNVFSDQRIGEKRKGMPEEDKIIRRSAAEKSKQFKHKANIFNLQDTDEFLTHKGKPLGDIERYEDPREGSDSEDERLDADFVSDANFGGFMKIKSLENQPINAEDYDAEGRPKTHKQIIQELILASKKKKQEKAKEADENYDLVCKLDDTFKTEEFRNLLLLGGKSKSLPGSKDSGVSGPEENKQEEYDRFVKELQFETKTGNASNRIQTDWELIEGQKINMQVLEKERSVRMQMNDPDTYSKHRSADDLDSGFETLDDPSGELAAEGGDLIESDVSDKDSEEDNESDKTDLTSEANSDIINTNQFTAFNSKSFLENNERVLPFDSDELTDIPFVSVIPTSFQHFESHLKKYRAHFSNADVSTICARLNKVLTVIVLYNLEKKAELAKLFNFVMRYTLEAVEKPQKVTDVGVRIARTTVPLLHSLLLLNPTGCVLSVQNGEIFDDFYPLGQLPVFKLLYFDICSSLFSCTDFKHSVLSPIKAKLSEVLYAYKVETIADISKLLYTLFIIETMCRESKRYCPEAINALKSILLCYSKERFQTRKSIIPSLMTARDVLYIDSEKLRNEEPENNLALLLSDEITVQDPTCEEKLTVLYSTLNILISYVKIYDNLQSAKEIFSPIRKIVEELQSQCKWCKSIKAKFKETMAAFNNIKQQKEVLEIAVSDRPKPLRLYEPLIEEDFDGMRKKKVPKGKQDTARLVHKVRQETKHAVRELRKDTVFLAKQQLKEQLHKDTERKRKVKDILGSLANQEGEYQKIKRKKK